MDNDRSQHIRQTITEDLWQATRVRPKVKWKVCREQKNALWKNTSGGQLFVCPWQLCGQRSLEKTKRREKEVKK